MFEKDAEEYAKNQDKYAIYSNYGLIVEHTFKDAAEFGYNKAKEDFEKQLKIKDKIIKQLNDYTENFLSFDENGDPVY